MYTSTTRFDYYFFNPFFKIVITITVQTQLHPYLSRSLYYPYTTRSNRTVQDAEREFNEAVGQARTRGVSRDCSRRLPS